MVELFSFLWCLPAVLGILVFLVNSLPRIYYSRPFLSIAEGDPCIDERQAALHYDPAPNFFYGLERLLPLIFLSSLLLIILGIIAFLSYSMTFFIIADNPSICSWQAMRKSRKMMRGYKWKLFCLFWRFFAWGVLCVLTLGIGFLWLWPYMQTAMAHFYEDIRPRMNT